jgi:hypothetical protein
MIGFGPRSGAYAVVLVRFDCSGRLGLSIMQDYDVFCKFRFFEL